MKRFYKRPPKLSTRLINILIKIFARSIMIGFGTQKGQFNIEFVKIIYSHGAAEANRYEHFLQVNSKGIFIKREKFLLN